VEDHLKWEGKNGRLGAMPQWDPKAKPLVEGLGASPPEVDDTFCENVLFCHGFKNDIAISAFIAYTCSI